MKLLFRETWIKSKCKIETKRKREWEGIWDNIREIMIFSRGRARRTHGRLKYRNLKYWWIYILIYMYICIHMFIYIMAFSLEAFLFLSRGPPFSWRCFSFCSWVVTSSLGILQIWWLCNFFKSHFDFIISWKTHYQCLITVSLPVTVGLVISYYFGLVDFFLNYVLIFLGGMATQLCSELTSASVFSDHC